ncbi:MAG: alpha-1,4-glucan--maltose-1-phosphate maltosyltransferase [Acidobacteriota bacterium]|nr:MAG: alpha-1,4-glucan--maltose-1-phosphate maltosyltransferase [Acidobacteriota bacterium]
MTVTKGVFVLPSADLNGRQRVAIEGVWPEIDGGRFPIKRTTGDRVEVEADIFADGHDQLTCMLLYRRVEEIDWSETPMVPLGNDRWRGGFEVGAPGRYLYTIEAWVDHYRTWRHDLRRRLDAQQDVTIDLQIGAGLVEQAASRADGTDRRHLQVLAGILRNTKDPEGAVAAALDEAQAALVLRYADRRFATRYAPELRVIVDRARARFSTWYEMFPRSCSPEPGRHGTLQDCVRLLPYIAGMGFDVLYLPPIHPIGRTLRKGRNNSVVSEPGDVGSPWAIGAAEGGHTAVHPDLGTLDDLRTLVREARTHGIEIALDIAFQCSPDHPWVQEHPEWFRRRPDGTIQYAENPPKKYQDIYPFDFETDAWQSLWEALADVFFFWIEQGVRIFRVDNPHTKALPFWEWAIDQITARHPDVIFLSEAFTRPRVMERLAKLGFTQSYTYFTWRNSAAELREYFTELTGPRLREFFRPNLWPNTPDILHEYLQTGGRPAFAVRAVLAATLGANYGIYGPAFELCENAPLHPGSEEYLNSEKYEIRSWNRDAPHSLSGLLTQLNRIRREHPALQRDDTLRFHNVDNPLMLCYSKVTADRSDALLIVVNLDPFYRQSGWVNLDLRVLGLEEGVAYEVDDLLTGDRFVWHGAVNYVELSPERAPAHVLNIRRPLRTERDVDDYR